MKSVIYRADRPNVNGVTYPLAELEDAVEKFNLKGGFATHENYPPQSAIVDMEKVAAKVVLEMDCDCVVAKIQMLDTAHGTMVRHLIEHELMGIQPTATGSITDGITSNMTIGKLVFVPKSSIGHLTDMKIVQNWINDKIDEQFYLLDDK